MYYCCTRSARIPGNLSRVTRTYPSISLISPIVSRARVLVANFSKKKREFSLDAILVPFGRAMIHYICPLATSPDFPYFTLRMLFARSYPIVLPVWQTIHRRSNFRDWAISDMKTSPLAWFQPCRSRSETDSQNLSQSSPVQMAFLWWLVKVTMRHLPSTICFDPLHIYFFSYSRLISRLASSSFNSSSCQRWFFPLHDGFNGRGGGAFPLTVDG